MSVLGFSEVAAILLVGLLSQAGTLKPSAPQTSRNVATTIKQIIHRKQVNLGWPAFNWSYEADPIGAPTPFKVQINPGTNQIHQYFKTLDIGKAYECTLEGPLIALSTTEAFQTVFSADCKTKE